MITLVVSGFVGALGCGEPYRPAEHDGSSFPLEGAHARASCEGCHGPPPFGSIVWDATCLSCHEVDRKAPDHYPGRGCADGGGCHTASQLTWSAVLGTTGVTPLFHNFLPLEGTHDLPCASCHTSATPSADDATGTSDLCWSCHEADRKDAQHYVETGLQFLDEPRWDCKACHDTESRTGAPLAAWGTGEGDHGNVRFPHAMVNNNNGQAPELWITACAACHPANPPVFQCTDSCHADLFVDTSHYGTYPGDAAECLDCHGAADIR